MSIHGDILLALDAKIEDATAGLNVTCVKGFPAFDRPSMTPPAAAVWWQRDDVGERAKNPLGGAARVWMTTFNVALFAQDEPRLMTYVAAYGAMMRNWHQDTISSTAMVIEASTLERLGPIDDTTVEAMRYAAQGTITFRYTR